MLACIEKHFASLTTLTQISLYRLSKSLQFPIQMPEDSTIATAIRFLCNPVITNLFWQIYVSWKCTFSVGLRILITFNHVKKTGMFTANLNQISRSPSKALIVTISDSCSSEQGMEMFVTVIRDERKADTSLTNMLFNQETCV